MNQESVDPNLVHLEMAVEAVAEIHAMVETDQVVAEAVVVAAAVAVVEEIHAIAEIKTVVVKVEIITTIIPLKKVDDPIDIHLQIAKVIVQIND